MHKSSYRIYYEDTDAGGVVYYANYLKFAERARTDYLRDKGILQSDLLRDFGHAFVVKNITADFIRPAKLDDMLDITTQITALNGASIDMQQTISSSNTELFKLTIKIAYIDIKNGRPVRIIEEVAQRIR